MTGSSLASLLLLGILFVPFDLTYSLRHLENDNRMKSATFLSPEFIVEPGSVQNRYSYNIEFPGGHVALKSFNAEAVDETGTSIPLYDTYLHHWVVQKYYQRKNSSNGQSDQIVARNSGICQGTVLGQYFGFGSETRKTATYAPDPYGIEIGNPAEIPQGYEERWMLNVHPIDTRGVEDRLGCIECRCNLYNITVDEFGNPIRPDYIGGLLCCYDHTQCKLRQGFVGARRSLYLRYTVKWIDWDSSVIPVQIFILDVTDNGKRSNSGITLTGDGCKVEYLVEPCKASGLAADGCIDAKTANLTMPTGGYVIYGVAHQHSGGMGSTIYGQGRRVICSSLPTYGKGKEAGNEDGYIVGMSACYPEPGSVKIADGEKITLESNYNNTQMHTGVMGFFYLWVADQVPSSTWEPASSPWSPVSTPEVVLQ